MTRQQPHCKYLLASLGTLGAALLFDSARAADLFLPATAGDGVVSMAAGHRDAGLHPREHRVTIARGVLASTHAQVELGGSGAFRLNVDTNLTFDALVEHAAPTAWGYSLSGQIAGESHGFVTLVVHDEMVTGNVWTSEGSYEIVPLGGGVHAVRALKEEVECGIAMIEGLPATVRTSGAGTDDGSVVDILVVWTPSAEARFGGENAVKAHIDLAIAFTNDTFQRSGALTSLNLVGTAEVDYEETGTYMDLDRLWDAGDGHLDNVLVLRDELGADLVHLVRGSEGGWATLGEAGLGISGSVYTFAHEIGHNFGVGHRRFFDTTRSYNHAFNDDSDDYFCASTITNQGGGVCRTGRPGRKVPYYSSPALWNPYDGRPLGISRFDSARGGNGPADGVLTINRMRRLLANYRPTKVGETAVGRRSWWPRRNAGYVSFDPPREDSHERHSLAEPSEAAPNALVTIPDVNLRRAVEIALGKTLDDAITRNEMASLSVLSASPRTLFIDEGRGVRNLSGLEYAVNLTSLRAPSGSISDLSPLKELGYLIELVLTGNNITDITPLSSLKSLVRLSLDRNYIADLAPLGDVKSLAHLILDDNRVSDLSPLRNMSSLQLLGLVNNRVSDITPIANLRSLRELWIGTNYVSNLAPLSRLRSLVYVQLSENSITDLSPLVVNSGLGDGDVLDVDRNPLNRQSIRELIPALRARGVEVNGPRVPDPDEREWTARDPKLYAAVQHAMEDHYGNHIGSAVTIADLARLPRLVERGRGIVNLAGLEAASSLSTLELSDNSIVDMSPLTGLESLRGLFLDNNDVSTLPSLSKLALLQYLRVSNNEIQTIAPLGDLLGLWWLAIDGNEISSLPTLPSSIQYLHLFDNSISNIDSLRDLSALIELQLSGNKVASIDPLVEKPMLRYLHLNDNQVSDISPLNMESLVELHIRNNAVQDISPLLNGGGLAMIDVRGNPLSEASLGVLAELRDAGITVLAGESVPYFPAAITADREGFVRVINNGVSAGEVFIEAVDDAGVRRGPVPVQMAGLAALHFNSSDLENGNRSKGILTGIGRPTAGDWRLELVSALDIEVLSYVRSEDGFVTAMHDVATRPMLPFVNPGSNDQQRSLVRVVNVEGERGLWTSGGYDDAGRWHPMLRGVEVGTGRAVTFTSAELETAHGLGDGQGKWWLRTRGFPWLSMSLLESPTGHLTNLTTVPDNVTTLADGTHRHRVPLFPEAGGAQEGFLRVINRSDAAGTVAIEAVDDAGNARGPIRVEVGALGTLHFNSSDLESGNADKGLAGGVGLGEGDWRLALTSELDLHVLAYIRTADGFVTAMHDVAPRGEDGSHRVVFFNPGSNRNHMSKLRLVNGGEGAARVTITGIDDAGGDSGTVTLSVPARRAVYFTSAELEAGDEGLEGSLGDGTGKWRLRVDADAPLTVMSLLESPTGHLANVSTGTAD